LSKTCFENPGFLKHSEFTFSQGKSLMRKRRRVEPRALLSALERFLAQSKVFEDSVVPFCDIGWLANLFNLQSCISRSVWLDKGKALENFYAPQQKFDVDFVSREAGLCSVGHY
jgi:hypothetical protein